MDQSYSTHETLDMPAMLLIDDDDAHETLKPQTQLRTRTEQDQNDIETGYCASEQEREIIRGSS